MRTVHDPEFARKYAESCERAIADQGLRPMIERLRAEGIDHHVEQTGGFTMVITAPTRGGTVAVTNDRVPNGPDAWLVGYYPGDTWYSGEVDYDELPNFTELTEDQAVAKVRYFQEM